MDDDTGTAPLQQPEPETEPQKPAPMGRGFYLVIGLIGVLVLLIIFFNLPAAETAAPVTLTHTDWMLMSYADSSGTVVAVQNGSLVSAQFGTGGQVTGSAGCNQYHATYFIMGDSMNITGLASTMMYCPAPGVMALESNCLYDLQQVSLYRIHGTELHLYDATGKPLLLFAPAGS
jgi:heat shock protein HslJ